MVLYFNGHTLRYGVSYELHSHDEEQYPFFVFVHLFQVCTPFKSIDFDTIILQSVTVPLQGFLNAIVYGQTQEDFVHMMESTARFFSQSSGRRAQLHLSRDIVSEEGEMPEEEMERRENKSLLDSGSFSLSPTPSVED